MRREPSHARYAIVIALLLLLLAGQASAGESVTTLRDRTLTVTGTWEKNTSARIPFTIDDFQGFKYLNLSYQMLNPVAASSQECGLVFKLTTDEYFLSWRNGSNLVFVPVGEDLKVYNAGFITFDPRKNPEPSWQVGRYWLLMSLKPVNCVNEAHIRLDLVREAEGVPETVITTPRRTTPVEAPREMVLATATVHETVSAAAMGKGDGEMVTPAATPTKASLPVSMAVMSVILAARVLGRKRKG